MQVASPQSLIWFDWVPMSAWHRRWCQLDNDRIASDLSGTAFIVVIVVIYCSNVLKLCHALLGTLPFTLIGLATNCGASHFWQTQSETLETAETPRVTWSSQTLSFSCEQITCTSLLSTHLNKRHTLCASSKILHFDVIAFLIIWPLKALLHCMPIFTHLHPHSNTETSCQTAHHLIWCLITHSHSPMVWEQFEVQYYAQGHFSMWKRGWNRWFSDN